MKKILSLTIFVAMLAFGAKGAWADGPYPVAIGGPTGVVTPADNTGEIEIYQAINSLLGSSYASNAAVDALEYTGNTSTWTQTGTGGYAVIGLGAGGNNALDAYNVATPGTLVQLSPPETGDKLFSPYIGAPSVPLPGNVFGFALNQNSGSKIWYSNPLLNSDSMDHIVTYSLSGLTGTVITVYDPTTNSDQQITLEDPYFLGFEDKPETNPITGAPSDLDYNDLMVLVNGVAPSSAPVPEPMTVALFGVGLLAMAGFTFRRNNFSMMA